MYSSLSMDKSAYTTKLQNSKRTSLDLPVSKYSPSKSVVSYPFAIKEELLVDVKKEPNTKYLPCNERLIKSDQDPRLCVQMSYSCSEINSMVSLQNIQSLNNNCSNRGSMVNCTQDISAIPLEKLSLNEKKIHQSDLDMDHKSVPILNNSQQETISPIKSFSESVFPMSETSEVFEYTNPNADCITSTTEDDTFYSPLEELSVSTLSLSIDLPTESISNIDTNMSYSLCCDVFTSGEIEDTNSVLGEDLVVDKTDDRPVSRDQTPADITVACTNLPKQTITNCFPI
uniref:Uncharacterized protein n=1 Tax=Clastoptera arizonana TaxID=38151 RepID=A0A1B6CTS9_9HEMI